MMQSEIRTVSYPNGEIQRYQTVRWKSWEQLNFLAPDRAPDALPAVTIRFEILEK